MLKLEGTKYVSCNGVKSLAVTMYEQYRSVTAINESEIIIDPKTKRSYYINTSGVATDGVDRYGHAGRIKITPGSKTKVKDLTYSIPVDYDKGMILLDHPHFYQPKGSNKDKRAIELAGAFVVFAREELKDKHVAFTTDAYDAVEKCEDAFSNLSQKDVKELYDVSIGEKDYSEVEDIIKKAKEKGLKR